MTEEQKQQVLEFIQQAIDGLIYRHELIEKIEQATGAKIESYEDEEDAA